MQKKFDMNILRTFHGKGAVAPVVLSFKIWGKLTVISIVEKCKTH